MRHSDKIIKIALIVCILTNPAYSAIKSGIDYSIPIDYTKLNQTELEAKADFYYESASNSCKLDDNMTSALNLYTILSNKDPQNIDYILKLGKLYDNIGKDRYAKSNYYRAVNINAQNPEPYLYLGHFFYKREQFRKALKYYMLAYEKGLNSNYDLVYNIGDIYQKLGDTKKALEFLENANSINSNEELVSKINKLNDMNSVNKEYYK